MSRSVFFPAFALVVVACSSASSTTPAQDPNALPQACQDVAIDRFKELAIVDPAVIDDPRSRNAEGGVWSFRHRMEEFAGGSSEAANALTVAWLTSWQSPTKVNLFDVAARPQVEKKALCNWLRATPANACDSLCTTCTTRRYDLANAPFRLMMISNRGDLVTTEVDPTTNGEARFAYALTDGPGDDPASPPMLMSVIFEYRQVLRGRTRAEVAGSWHALGEHRSFDESYRSDLEKLMNSFTESGAAPDSPRGSAIHQVRTNEREFDWAWDFREFVLADSGLTPWRLQNTPDRTLNGSPQLAKFLKDNRASVLDKSFNLPDNLCGGGVALDPWTAPVDSDLLRAFSTETCNGCHQNNNIDFNFHIAPNKAGIARLSTFMNNPADQANDDLSRREGIMRRTLCTQ